MTLLLPVFLLGLAVGSFLNVAIMRGGRGEGLGGRSRCESCGKILSPLELIPVFSFFLQKGRCKNCGSPLSWQYPAVELTTAIFFSGTWLLWQTGLLPSASLIRGIITLLAIFSGVAAAIVIFISDLRYKLIPNGAILALLGTGIVLRSFDRPSLAASVIGALALSLVPAAFWFLSKGAAMGFGDAKLVFSTSLMLGYPLSLPALLFAFWLGGIAGIFLLASGAKTIKDPIPFGPFILCGAVLAQVLGKAFLAASGLSEFL